MNRQENNMKLLNIILIFGLTFSYSQIAMAEDSEELPCGTEMFNGVPIQKLCLQKNYTAKSIDRPGAISKFFATVVSGGHGYLAGNGGNEGMILGYSNRVLDMQGHVWDFSKQEHPDLVLMGHDSVVKYGVILNATVSLGYGRYFSPNFERGSQKSNSGIGKGKNPDIINYGYLYADNYFDCKKGTYIKCEDKSKDKLVLIENIFFSYMKAKVNNIFLSSWGGGISDSQLILKNNIYVDGSKATILNNRVLSDAQIFNNKSLFSLQATNQSKLIDNSKQIFPDQWDDKTAIPSVLYVKFSPDTVIDGNTFTLTHKNDQTYAIVLDHSPRVRITNNTFNGFKVPILMDQWSSIVDDKGNVLNPDQFAGDVEMNRKGEVVRK